MCTLFIIQEAEESAQKQTVTKGGEDKKGGGKGKGRAASKAGGGKKGKETPATEVAPAIPLPEKPLVSMRKRGEEDLDSKYIGMLVDDACMYMYMYIHSATSMWDHNTNGCLIFHVSQQMMSLLMVLVASSF